MIRVRTTEVREGSVFIPLEVDEDAEFEDIVEQARQTSASSLLSPDLEQNQRVVDLGSSFEVLRLMMCDDRGEPAPDSAIEVLADDNLPVDLLGFLQLEESLDDDL